MKVELLPRKSNEVKRGYGSTRGWCDMPGVLSSPSLTEFSYCIHTLKPLAQNHITDLL